MKSKVCWSLCREKWTCNKSESGPYMEINRGFVPSSQIKNSDVGTNVVLDRNSKVFCTADWGDLKWGSYYSSSINNDYCEIEVINESHHRVFFW